MKFQKKVSGPFNNKPTGLVALLALFFTKIVAQTYAPPAGQVGTSAMHMDSSAFVSWAGTCTVTPGYQDISNPGLGFASVGDNTMATGKAQSNAVVSLGDGGSAICTFEKPVKNGSGFDFAVFENGFDDIFLELAFVEVSSDGVYFFRFPAHSLTDTVTQTDSFGPTDATKINNLAGKYRGGYGTPFDLQELSGIAGLDINAITHIKITDVVGSIDNNYASRDAHKNKINDPWPTAFPSGGFDLDAIGVIHESPGTGRTEQPERASIKIYPNPVVSGEVITVTGFDGPHKVELTDLTGKCIFQREGTGIPTLGLDAGVYLLKIVSGAATSIQKILVR